MAVSPGMRLTPARLNVQQFEVNLGTAYPLTTTHTDLPGVTLNVVTVNPNQAWQVTWSGDWNLTTAGSLTGVLSLVVDNVAWNPREAVWNPANVAAGQRETEGQTASGVFATPGTHNFKLRASRIGASGAATLGVGHTGMTVIVYP